MGVITEAIEALIGEYIRERGLVVWFDPERHYEAVARGLNAGQERVLRFDGSFYKLRLEAEPLVRGLNPPKLLVYLPIAWEQAKEPLAELLALGVALRPGVSGNRNTRLAVVARKALKGRVAEARLADLDRQIEQGRLTLAELEELVSEGGVWHGAGGRGCPELSGEAETRRRVGVAERLGGLGAGIEGRVRAGGEGGGFCRSAPGAARAPSLDERLAGNSGP
jgi:hypothetical protein